MRALMDVNVLIALIDVDHKFHRTTKAWVGQNASHGWASCPLTQNGCLRIMSQASYTNAFTLQTLVQHLQGLCKATDHQFINDDLSLLDSQLFQHGHIHSPKQLTDLYLLALAVKHGARFVTLDERIPLSAVKGAQKQHLVVI